MFGVVACFRFHVTTLVRMHKTGCSGETQLVLHVPSHHALENDSIMSSIVMIVTVITMIIVIIIKLHAGVLELIEFIRKENIKTLVEHIVDQHIERYTAVASSPPTSICCLYLCLTGWLPDGSSC